MDFHWMTAKFWTVLWPIVRFLIILGILVFVHELGHFIVAKLSGIYVHRFALGFGTRIAGYRGKETDYCICAMPLGGYVKMAGQEDLPAGKEGEEQKPGDDAVPEVPAGREYYSKSVWVRTLLILAGPVMNFIVGFLMLSGMYYVGIDVPEDKAVIGKVMKGLPAGKAGIRENDRFLNIGGEPVATWTDIAEKIVNGSGQTVTIELERDGETISVTLTPVDNPDGGYRIGIGPSTETVRFGALESLENGFRHSSVVVGMLFTGLGRIFVGKESVKSLAGPVGIYKIIGDKAKEGFQYLVNIVASLSICLFAFNLLPVPILDGGHVVLNIIEIFRKKQLERRYMEIVQNVGFVLIVCLFVLVTYNDILRLFMK